MNYKFKKRTKVIIGILIVIIIAISSFAVYKYVFSNKTVANNKVTVVPADKTIQLDNQAGANPSKEELNKVQTELSQLVKGTSDKDVKQIYLSKAIELYTKSNDFKSALPLAEQSEKIKATALTVASIAYIYVGLGDYAKAAQYYQMAADRSVKTDDPTVRSSYNDYLISKREAEARLQ